MTLTEHQRYDVPSDLKAQVRGHVGVQDLFRDCSVDTAKWPQLITGNPRRSAGAITALSLTTQGKYCPTC